MERFRRHADNFTDSCDLILNNTESGTLLQSRLYFFFQSTSSQCYISGILPFVIPNDYRGILSSLVLSLSLTSISLVVFLLLKYFSWRKLQDVTEDDFSLFGFSQQSLDTVREFSSFGSWLLSIFKRSRIDIRENFGPDVELFLRGQLMNIAYTTVVCVICLTVILPLNLTGHHFNDPV